MDSIFEIWHWLVDLFRANPVIPIFLTLGIGFWLGGLRIRSFSLGPVTATLIVGVIIGQMDIAIPDAVKSMAFLVFLFAIGYRVGPQFFRSLKGDGLRQICFALVEAIVCVAVVVIISRLMGYGKGATIGIFAGSQTVSAG
ncbi:MAG: aspartate-alanine antiporter, partial [Muribaculaceae bacterium]|nr:aspartate-alanine antiporter [Muribaculaceae bacterium]